MERIDSNKIEYKDFIKVEFRDMLAKFLEDRRLFHVYTIDRCCITAIIAGFSYRYIQSSDPLFIKELDLGEYGKIRFSLEDDGEYAKIITKNYKEIIKNVLISFPVVSN